MSDEDYSWQPATAAQRAALNSEADILFFGGSAGSLKTETLLMDAVQEYENPRLRGVIFRKTFAEMTDLIDKTANLYTPLGGEWVGPPKYKWTFPSGATIRFAYMKTDDDWRKYLGPRYSFIGWDESTLHTEKQIRNLIGRLGSTDRTLRLRVRLCSNPGSIGASWHQSLFLRGQCPVHNPKECSQPGAIYNDRSWPSDGSPLALIDKKSGTVLKRLTVSFIPGKLSDHNLLGPDYAANLSMMAGGASAAMLDGCWCELEGAYFSFLNKSMIKPLAECEVEWWHNHFLSIDYGFGKSSSSAGLYVRTPGEPAVPTIYGIDPRKLASSAPAFPEGRFRKIGELVIPHKSATEFAEMVVDAFIRPQDGQQRRRIVAAFLDPANFKEIGDGHTIADQINEVLDPWDVQCVRASNDRQGGWQLVYKMLKSGEFEITDACPQTFEAYRTRMHDSDKPGDVKKVAGDPLDDVADETRYALYSFIQASEKPREVILDETIRSLNIADGRKDITSINVRYQQKVEELDRLEAPPRMGTRLGFRRR